MHQCDRSQPLQALSADQHGMEAPSSRNSGSDLRIVESPHNGYVCNRPHFSATSVHVSNSRVQSTGGGRSITTLAGEVDLHVFVIFLAEQGLPESSSHSEWPTQQWFRHLIQL